MYWFSNQLLFIFGLETSIFLIVVPMIIVASPIMLVVAIAINAYDGGPAQDISLEKSLILKSSKERTVGTSKQNLNAREKTMKTQSFYCRMAVFFL